MSSLRNGPAKTQILYALYQNFKILVFTPLNIALIMSGKHKDFKVPMHRSWDKGHKKLFSTLFFEWILVIFIEDSHKKKMRIYPKNPQDYVIGNGIFSRLQFVVTSTEMPGIPDNIFSHVSICQPTWFRHRLHVLWSLSSPHNLKNQAMTRSSNSGFWVST